MTSERGLWHTLRREMSCFGELRRIENRVDLGTPDVVYCLQSYCGFLELKELDVWPKRWLTIDCLTKEQVLWLRAWERAGGTAHLLVQVERSYLLFDPDAANLIYTRSLPSASAREVAKVYGEGCLPTRELLRFLRTSRLPTMNAA